MSDSDNEVEKTSYRSPTYGNNWSTFKPIYINYAECKGFGSVVKAEDVDPNLPVGQHKFSEDAETMKKEKKAVKKESDGHQLPLHCILKGRQASPGGSEHQ